MRATSPCSENLPANHAASSGKLSGSLDLSLDLSRAGKVGRHLHSRKAQVVMSGNQWQFP